MGKTVKMIFVAVVAITLVVVGQPHLAALLVGLGMSAMVAAVAAAIIIAVVTAGISMLIMGKPKTLSNSLFDRLQTSVVPTAPRRIVFGKTAGGADERFHEKTTFSGTAAAVASALISNMFGGGSSKKNDYLFKVIALASHKVHSVLSVYLEDELCFNGTSTVGKFTAKNGLMIQAVKEGSSSNATAWGSGSYWSANSKFTGCAYIKTAHRLDPDVYPDGIPSRITTVVEGCPVYDPRLDSTNGGSGPHRPNDQTTWTYYNGADEIGRNPALCLLTYLLGWKINNKPCWGMNVPPARIDFANFITYANVCDEAVALQSGGAVKRYQCDGIWSTNDTHETVIQGIAVTMGTARLVDTCGLYQLVGGYDDLDGPIITFTERDLIGQYEWRPSAKVLSDHYNIVRGRFCNPAKLYQLEDYGEVSVAPKADGVPRTHVVELGAVTRAETCQRIAKQLLAREAYQGVFVGNFMPSAFTVQVGSLVRMVLPQQGWAQPGKLFRVIDQTESADLIFQMSLQEEHANIYAWDSDEFTPLPSSIRPPGYNPNEAASVANLAAVTSTETSSSGAIVSRIVVTWDEPESSVGSIQLEASTDAGATWTSLADRFNHRAEEFIFSAPVSGVSTVVRARFRMVSGVYGDYSTTTLTAAPGGPTNAVVGYLTDESATFAADSSGNVL